jgi:hypothetical protein
MEVNAWTCKHDVMNVCMWYSFLRECCIVKFHEYCIILRDEFCYDKLMNTTVRIISNVVAHIYIYIYIFLRFWLWKTGSLHYNFQLEFKFVKLFDSLLSAWIDSDWYTYHLTTYWAPHITFMRVITGTTRDLFETR